MRAGESQGERGREAIERQASPTLRDSQTDEFSPRAPSRGGAEEPAQPSGGAERDATRERQAQASAGEGEEEGVSAAADSVEATAR